MPEMFDYLNAITYNKKNIMKEDPYAEDDYKPYYINKNLAQHMSCLFSVNEMNFRPFTDKKLQFDYLINTIRKKFRRSSKWLKPDFVDDIECVKEYFTYSNKKAKEALKILTKSDIDMIKYKLRKGGEHYDRNDDRSVVRST